MSMRTNFAECMQLEEQGFENLRFLREAAYLWMYRGEAEKARTIFEALNELAPNSPVGMLGLCELQMAAGKYRDAERSARKATRAPGIDAQTMAFAYMQQGRALLRDQKFEKAWPVLARALEVDPGSDVGETARELIEALRSLRTTTDVGSTQGTP